MKSPFKFLDSFTKDDKDIFFGRDKEIEELHSRIFESKILLVYGISGTGKTSLINCGLANKFEESDWLPVFVRRGKDITESLLSALEKQSITPFGKEEHNSLQKAILSIYLDHFKPVFLIFDQIEEVFIFGSRDERQNFIRDIQKIISSDLQCRIIFVIREEYLAGITEFEEYIPGIMKNRLRVEKMVRTDAINAIEGPCKAFGINVEPGFSELLLERLNPLSAEVELTFLQIYLDRLYRLIDNEKISFTKQLIDNAGNVKDLLGEFLDEQVGKLNNSEEGLSILKSFVSVKGTKRQVNEDEIHDTLIIIGKDVTDEKLSAYIQEFVNLRILKEKDDNGRYELRHDSLAAKIFEKINLVEKELFEVKQFIENAYQYYEKRGVLLSSADLRYIAPYEDMLRLSKSLEELIRSSRKSLEKAIRQRRAIITFSGLGLILILLAFSWWALSERNKALRSEKNARQNAIESNLQRKLAEKANLEAENAKLIVENQLYKNISNSLSVSIDKLNILYTYLENPLSISASGIKNERLIIKVKSGNALVYRKNEKFLIRVYKPNEIVMLEAKGITNNNDTIYLGTRTFRVKEFPNPVFYLGNKTSGEIGYGYIRLNHDFKYDLRDFPIEGDFYKFKRAKLFIVPTKGNVSLMEVTSAEAVRKSIENNMGLLKLGAMLILTDINYTGIKSDVKSPSAIVLTISKIDKSISDTISSYINYKQNIFNIAKLTAGKYFEFDPFVLNFLAFVVAEKCTLESEIIESKKWIEKSLKLNPYCKESLFTEAYINLRLGITKNIELPLNSYFDSIFNSKTLNNQQVKNKVYEFTELVYTIKDKNARKIYANNLGRYVLKFEGKLTLSQKMDYEMIDIDDFNTLSDQNEIFNGAHILFEYATNTDDPSKRNKYLRNSLNLYEKLIKEDSIEINREDIAMDCSNNSRTLLHKKEFNIAMDFINLAIKTDPEIPIIYTILPLCYLLNNRWNDAEKIFLKYKDKKYQDKTYKDVFVSDLHELEKNGINHQDFDKALILLIK
jgi:hypothetical protein